MQRDVDLIPNSYRQRLQYQRWSHLFLLALGLILVVIVLLWFGLAAKNANIQEKIAGLQQQKNQVIQQQQQYNELLAAERRLQKNIEILKSLRGGPSVQRLLKTLDRVLDGSVWFLSWRFNRLWELTEIKPEAVQTGYFIVIPQENSNTDKQQAWRLNAHMGIKGQARDHLSFSRFVQALLQQPEISDVKVVDTSVRQYVSTEVVDFNLIVVINNQVGDEHL